MCANVTSSHNYQPTRLVSVNSNSPIPSNPIDSAVGMVENWFVAIAVKLLVGEHGNGWRFIPTRASCTKYCEFLMSQVIKQ